MEKQLIPFTFESHNITVHLDANNEPWWEAQDVCAILGIRDVSKAVVRLKLGEKRTSESRNVLIINEKGLYRLIMRSNKPEAERFQDWVFGEVLPQIRKTGRYEVPAETALPVVHDQALKMLIDMAYKLDATQHELAIIRAEQHQQREALIVNQQQTIQALTVANQALEAQSWISIHQFLVANRLDHTMSLQEQQDYGRYLTGYCQDHGLRVYEIPVAGQRWPKEKQYHIGAIRDTLPGWLARRYSQLPMVVPDDGSAQ